MSTPKHDWDRIALEAERDDAVRRQKAGERRHREEAASVRDDYEDRLADAYGYAGDMEAELHRVTAQRDALLAAAKRVRAGLDSRIDAASASGRPVPVFDGIAELHAAITDAEGGDANG